MAAIRDFGDIEAGDAADTVDLAKKHLVQPWPYAGSIGTEARSLMTSATASISSTATESA